MCNFRISSFLYVNKYYNNFIRCMSSVSFHIYSSLTVIIQWYKWFLVLTLGLFGREQRPAALFGTLYAPGGPFRRFICARQPFSTFYMRPFSKGEALSDSLYLRPVAFTISFTVPHSTAVSRRVRHLYYLISYYQFSIPAICPQHIFHAFSYDRPCRISNNARTWIWKLNQ